jgi:hypothetical protein
VVFPRQEGSEVISIRGVQILNTERREGSYKPNQKMSAADVEMLQSGAVSLIFWLGNSMGRNNTQN